MSTRLILFTLSLVTMLFALTFTEPVSAQPVSRRAPPVESQARPVQRPAAPPAVETIRHHTSFKRVPRSTLQIRAVSYDGATNGSLTVQVQNPTTQVQTFRADGLYFIPDGDPNTAPQRLGAVGPIHLATTSQVELQQIELLPGSTVEVVLDVFCIDSHRSSPSPQNTFRVANARMPRSLVSTIEHRATAAVAEERAKGAVAPRKAAKSKIQSEVWRSRDSQWIELDGEGRQEQGKQ